VLFQALEPETDADAAKMSASIRELLEEDPSLELRRDSQTGQTLLLGMGELQLEVALDRLKREYGVHCRASTPRVAYRETCSRAAQGQGEVDRSVGGRGQFARISLSLEPAERGSGVHFEVSSPSSLPRDFVRAVEDGVGEGLNSGGRAGYPIVDLRVKLLGGEHHSVDSSEFAFRVAAGKALLSAFANSGPIVLEPIMKVEIVTPNEYMGSVVGEINARRGTVIQITARAGQQVVLAEAPLATLFGIATDLRSSSQGRATCTLQFSHYGNLPASLADQLVTQGTNQENRHGQGKV
jgi:elongation factor G